MTNPIECALCDYKGHILAEHIIEVHGLTILMYMRLYGNARSLAYKMRRTADMDDTC